MTRPTVRVGALVLTALTVTGFALGSVVALDGSLVVSGDRSEVAPQTVTFNGTDYRVTEVVRVTRGERLTARATSPENLAGIDLYDRESLIYDRPTTVNESVSFTTVHLTPGEYLLTTQDGRGRFQTFLPVVVTGYNATLDDTTTTESGEQQFSVKVTKTAQGPTPERVEVVVFNDNRTRRIEATKTGERTYTATADLEPGEYRTYVEVGANDELIGLSDATTVTVAAQQTASPTPEPTETQTAAPTQTPAVTQSPEASPVTDANMSGDGDAGGLGVRLSELVGGGEAQPPGGLFFGAGVIFMILVLSTVAYQAVYSLRRR